MSFVNLYFKTKNGKASVYILPLIFCFLLVSHNIFAQNLPDEIRGYKVYRTKISVKDNSVKAAREDSEAVVNFDDPQPTDISPAGVSFEISAEIFALRQNGKIDFLTFENFRVNGLPVEIEEYREPFEISKNKIIRLPKPVKITVGFGQALRGIWREQRDSREFWRVSGRVFVFGHFKKGFLKFKRVIPVDINLQIKNPIKSIPPES